jgi:hypothetical protein
VIFSFTKGLCTLDGTAVQFRGLCVRCARTYVFLYLYGDCMNTSISFSKKKLHRCSP